MLAAVPFTPGNIVVYRVGDGVASLVSGGNSVFLDEYTLSGSLVQSIPLVDDTVNGPGNTSTLNASGTVPNEGMLTLSVDSHSLVATGYDAAIGQIGGTARRVVGLVGIDAGVDLSTTGTFNTGNNFRSAFRNGNQIYTIGGTGGVKLVNKGTNSSGTSIAALPDGARAISIVGGQLYIATNTSTGFRLGSVGNGTPTTAGQTTTNLPGFPATGSYNQFVFADLDPGVAGVDTLYAAEDVTGQISKFSLVGGNWAATGAIAAPAVRGLTAIITGTSVALYGATGSNNSATGGGTLYAFTDTTGYNATVSGTATSIATAGTKTAFRGVALVPDEGVAAISGLGSTHNYVAGDAAILVGNTATFSDLSNFKGGALQVSLSSGGTVDDVLGITAGNKILFGSGAVNYDGMQIGTYPTSGPGSGLAGNDLTISFNAVLNANSVTSVAVQALLRQITFNTNAAATAGDRVVQYKLQQNDSQFTTSSQTLRVTRPNQAPTAVEFENTLALDENAATGSNIRVADIAVIDDGLGTNDLSLSGPDAAHFVISGSSLFLVAGTILDYETQSSYRVTVSVDDASLGATPDAAADFVLNVTNLNDNAPTISGPNAISIAENTTAISSYSASDLDGDTSALTLTGPDAALFTFDEGNLVFAAAPDSENPADDEANNVYNVTINADDGVHVTTLAVAITVTNANDNSPSISGASTVAIDENVSVVGAYSGNDADGDSPVLSLAGPDAALFTISDGNLAFAVAPDFESPGDSGANNVYSVTVTANNGLNTTNLEVAITVANDNDNAPSINGAVAATVAENVATVGSYSASDADGNAPTLSLTGPDAALFSITDGSLTFLAPPDFENPQDVGANRIYNVTVNADDGVHTTTRMVAITVTNDNDHAPTIGGPANIALPENTTAIATYSSNDVDGDAVFLTLTGPDAGLFTILDGDLAFAASPDFENPQDVGANNVYNVTVNADDGAHLTTLALIITVSNENDNAPSISGASTASVAENTASVGDYMVTDADGNAPTITLTGSDAALFTITGDTLSFIVAPDFENPADEDRNNVYNVVINADDGLDPTTHVVEVTVTNENDNAPSIVGASTRTISEHTKAIGIYSAEDLDRDTPTLSLSGPDAALFKIADGNLEFLSAPDFENPESDGGGNVYSVTVNASDGLQIATLSIAITVSNENDNAPSISGASTASVAENAVAAGSYLTSDADGDNLAITLIGPDAGLFTISGGDLVFKVPPDFENPQDEGRNNVYDVIVNANDGSHTTTAIVAVSVVDTNEAPTSIVFSNIVQSVVENSSTSADIRLANIGIVDDGLGTNVLAISGPDAAFFKILNGSLFLRSGTSLNFETKNTFTINLAVNDDTLGASSALSTAFTLAVEDRNEAPILSPTHPVFSPIPEDATSSHGRLVSSLLVGAFSDVDAAAQRGIAITSLSPRVSLQYKLGSASWVRVSAFTETSALILPASALVRLVPEPDFNGTVQFSYRAWDRSDGALAGSRMNLTGRIGLGGAYSLAVDNAGLTIRPVNDAPVLLPTQPSAGMIGQGNRNPPGIRVTSLLTGASDVDKSAVAGVAVIGLEGANNGIWQYRFGTRAWAAIGSVSDGSALLIPAAGWVRFLPNITFHGQVKISYRAWDGTQGSAGNKFKASESLGGIHAFSTGQDSCTLIVDAAPILKQPDASPVGYALNSKAGVHFMLGAMTNPGSLAKLLDPDSPEFDTGILRVRATSGGRIGDQINLGWNFSVSGSNVLFFNPQNSTTIRLGMLTKSGTDGAEWSITFNNNATRDLVQRLINSMRFITVGGVAGQRKLAISVSDGDGATSNTLTRTINVR